MLRMIFLVFLLGAAWAQQPTSPPSLSDPRITSFSVDLNVAKLQILLDAPIRADAVLPSLLYLQSTPKALENVTETLQLGAPFNNLRVQGNTTELTFAMNANDFARVKNSRYLCRNGVDSVYLVAERGAFVSPFGEQNLARNATNAVPASAFLPDVSGPYLTSFDLDMDRGLLGLSFTEPVDVTSFRLEGLVLQSRKTSLSSTTQITEIYELQDTNQAEGEGVFSTSNFNRTLVYELGQFNVNMIKRLVGLAIAPPSTWLSARAPFINDTSANPVSLIGLSEFLALPVKTFHADLTPPRLRFWDFTLEFGGIVRLHFSETIYINYFNFSGVLFTNGVTNTTNWGNYSSLRVSNPVNVTNYNSEVVVFNFNEEQIDELKAKPELLTNKHNSYVVLDTGVVIDTAAKQNRYLGMEANSTHPMQVQHFEGDISPPFLEGFTLDMTTKVLSLLLSETVVVRTGGRSGVDLSALSLQSDSADGLKTEVLHLSGSFATLLTEADGPFLEILLSDAAFNQLKAFRVLAKSQTGTYLAVKRFFVSDAAGNPILEVFTGDALQVAGFVADAANPFLVSWYPNFANSERNRLIFEFSEPLNKDTFDVTAIQLSSDLVLIQSTKQLELSSDSRVENEEDDEEVGVNVVVVEIGVADMNRLRERAPLCVSVATCFLSFDASLANDTSTFVAVFADDWADGKYSEPFLQVEFAVEPVAFLAPSQIIPDTSPPLLLNYSFDMKLGALSFVFSKPVQAQTLNSTGIYLRVDNVSYSSQSINSGPVSLVHRISDYAFSEERNVRDVTVQLSLLDSLRIKLLHPLASSLSTSKVVLSSDSIVDTFGNQLNETTNVLNSFGITPFLYTPDTIPPAVIAVYLAPDKSNFTVYFDDIIDVTSIDLSAFVLVSDAGVARAIPDARIYESAGKLDVSGSIFQLGWDGNVAGNLENGMQFTSKNRTNALVLGLEDISADLSSARIAQEQASTFFYISRVGSVRDASTNANPVAQMTTANQVRDGLRILSFRLDMNTRSIVFELAFKIGISQIDPTQISLSATRAPIDFSLTGYSEFSIEGEELFLRISMTEQDYRIISRRFQLVRKDLIEVFVGINAIIDEYGKPLSSAQLLPCSVLIPDSQDFVLDSFKLDLSLGVLSLFFNKEVLPSSVLLVDGSIVLQSNRTSGSTVLSLSSPNGTDIYFLALTNLTLAEDPEDAPFRDEQRDSVHLSLNDGFPLTNRDRIHLFQSFMGTSVENTYLSVSAGFVFDYAAPANPLTAVSTQNALQATAVVQDVTKPLLNFFDLDMTERLLTLYFNEAVDANRVAINSIQVLANPDIPSSSSYILSHSRVRNPFLGTFNNTDDSGVPETTGNTSATPVLVIEIGALDMDNMMALAPNLIFSAETTHLAWPANTFFDISSATSGRNGILVQYFRYGIAVRNYWKDEAPPKIDSYNISIQFGTMDIQFSEIVNCTEVVPKDTFLFQYAKFMGSLSQFDVNVLSPESQELIINNAFYSSATGQGIGGMNIEREYLLTDASQPDCANFPIRSTTVRILIGLPDLINMKTYQLLLKTPDFTYLRVFPGGFRDVYGVENEVILDGDALSPHSFIPDTIRPRLHSFTVSDLAVVTLFFSEPMNVSSLLYSEVVFANAQVSPTKQYPLIRAIIRAVDDDLSVFTIDLGKDFTRMRTDSNVFYRQDETFLKISGIGGRDTSGNQIVHVNDSDAVQMGPAVRFWDLNMNSGVLTLHYTALVNSSFSLSDGMSVQNMFSHNSSTGLANTMNSTDLSVWNFTTSSFFDAIEERGGATNRAYSVLRVQLNDLDLNTLKLSNLAGKITELGTVQLFLAAKFGVTRSTQSDDVIPFSLSAETRMRSALQVRFYTQDTVGPMCRSFELDLNSGKLVFLFDEPVDLASLSLRSVTLVSSKNGTFVDLSSYGAAIDQETGSAVSLLNYTQLHLSLSTRDLNRIKTAYLEGGNTLDYLLMSAGAIQDLLGNPFVGNDISTPILQSVFIPDTSPPSFVAFIFDANSYRLTLIFDEFVDASSLPPSSIQILNGSDIYSNSSQFLQLGNYTLVEQQPQSEGSGSQIVLDLGFFGQDSLRLQGKSDLATEIGNTFIAITDLRDIFGNVNPETTVFQATEYVPNASPLMLLSFDLTDDLQETDKMRLTLYFSAYVNVSSVSCADFTLRSAPSSSVSTDVLNLLDICEIQTAESSPQIDILVAKADIGDVIGSTEGQTWLTIDTNTGINRITSDVFGNPLQDILPATAAMRVGPQVTKYRIDMNTGDVQFVFSKPVNRTTFSDPSSLGFFSTITGKSYFLYSSAVSDKLSATQASALLSNPVFSLSDNTTSFALLSLNTVEFSAVKRLVVREGDIYLLIRENAIVDFLNQTLVPRSRGGAWSNILKATNVVEDTTAPELLSFSLDLGAQTLSLSLSEPILLSSIVVSNLRIQADRSVSIHGNYLHLTGGETFQQEDNVLVINLTPSDAATLKLTENLATNLTTTYLSFEFETMADLTGNNYLPSISLQNGRKVGLFINDSVHPVLEYFDLDMSSDAEVVLALTFSEPVKADIFDPTQIVMQSRFFSRDGVNYTLTGGSVVSGDGLTIVVQLSQIDIIAMKEIPGLIRRRQSTYLLLSPAVTTDMAGNYLVPLSDMFASACRIYTPDRAPPTVEGVDLDMSTGVLTFTISEPVNLTSVDVTALTLQLRNSSTFIDTTLSAQSSVAQEVPLSRTVTIALSARDLDTIKFRYPLASALSNTWVSFLSRFMEDSSGNYLEKVDKSAPLPLTSWRMDTVLPTVEKYVLNMNRKLVRLAFSESIRADSVRVDQLVLQSSTARRFGKFQRLNDSTFPLGPDAASLFLDITLSQETMFSLKFNGIGLNAVTSFLVWSDIFASDNAGNFLYPFWDGSVFGFKPRVPDLVMVDTEGPILQRWYFFLDTSKSGGSLPQAAISSLESLNNGAQSGVSSDTPFSLFLEFDEPVFLTDASAISLLRRVPGVSRVEAEYSVSSRTNDSGLSEESLSNGGFSSGGVTVSYANYNTEVTIYLRNFCRNSSLVVEDRTAIGSTIATTFTECADSDVATPFFDFLGPVLSVQPESAALIDAENNALFEMREFSISLGPNAFVDFAEGRNNVVGSGETGPVKEGAPECSVCGAGWYVSQNCTTHSDRVCSRCTACKEGAQYTQHPCTPFQDTACAACSVCKQGKYTHSPCLTSGSTALSSSSPSSTFEGVSQNTHTYAVSPGRDTVCRVCSQCSQMEYVARECALGLDTLCHSCEKCDFTSVNIDPQRRDFVRRSCEVGGKYKTWFQDNCCEDDDGFHVLCKDKDRQNMVLASRNGRQGHAFTPPTRKSVALLESAHLEMQQQQRVRASEREEDVVAVLRREEARKIQLLENRISATGEATGLHSRSAP